MGRLGLGLGLARAITEALAGGGFVPIVSNGVLAPFVTFTRASTGTYFDSAGVMQTAAVNEPRIDYDPTTLALRGLLVEEQRTNLLLNSATLSTQSVTVTAVAHTLSFTGTGTVTLSGASTAGPLVGTGANNRVTLTFTPTAGSLTLTVSGSVTLAQLEAGAFATSYIPTTATAQTRAADKPDVTNLSSIGFNASEGAFYCEASQPAIYNNGTFFRLDDGTESERIYGFISLSAPRLLITDGGVIKADSSGAALTNGVVFKAAIGYKANDTGIAFNGNVAQDSAVTMPTVTRLNIGYNALNTAGTLNGHIRRLRYYPRRLPDAQLQALTA